MTVEKVSTRFSSRNFREGDGTWLWSRQAEPTEPRTHVCKNCRRFCEKYHRHPLMWRSYEL